MEAFPPAATLNRVSGQELARGRHCSDVSEQSGLRLHQRYRCQVQNVVPSPAKFSGRAGRYSGYVLVGVEIQAERVRGPG